MKKKLKKIKLTQLDWVDFTKDELLLIKNKEPQIHTTENEVQDSRTEYQILKDLGQLDLLD